MKTSIDALTTASNRRLHLLTSSEITAVERGPVLHEFNYRMSTFVIMWYVKIGGKFFDESSPNTC